MEIQQAIATAQKKMVENKKILRRKKEKWAKIKQKEINQEATEKEQKKKLLKLIQEKGRRADQKLREGIKFIESLGDHFTVHSGYKDAIYFCSNGSFKVQYWGMYMGNKNIGKLQDRFDSYGIKDLRKVLNADFKELLIKQILELPKNIRVEKEDAFKEMFE